MMARARADIGKAISHTSPMLSPTNIVSVCLTARGYTDGMLQRNLDIEILSRNCTELDLSENLITQRGASILAKLISFNKVGEIENSAYLTLFNL